MALPILIQNSDKLQTSIAVLAYMCKTTEKEIIKARNWRVNSPIAPTDDQLQAMINGSPFGQISAEDATVLRGRLTALVAKIDAGTLVEGEYQLASLSMECLEIYGADAVIEDEIL